MRKNSDRSNKAHYNKRFLQGTSRSCSGEIGIEGSFGTNVSFWCSFFNTHSWNYEGMYGPFQNVHRRFICEKCGMRIEFDQKQWKEVFDTWNPEETLNVAVSRMVTFYGEQLLLKKRPNNFKSLKENRK